MTLAQRSTGSPSLSSWPGLSKTSPGTSSRSSTARARPASTACSTRPQRARRGVRRALRRARSPSSTARRSPRRWTSWRQISELVGRAGNYARAALRDRHRRPRQRRAAAARPGARHGDRDEAAVLRPRVGRARRRRAPTSCWRPTASTTAATTCARCAATGRTCSPSPRRRSSTEKAVTGRERLGAAVLRADVARSRSSSPARTSPCSSTSRSAACMSPDREVRAHAAAGGHRGARARRCAPAPTSSTRCSHDKAADDRLRNYPTLDLEPQPRQRGQRRVGQALVEAVRGNYDIPQRWYRAQGAAARRRPPRRLRPHGAGRRRRTRRSSWDEARDARARRLRRRSPPSSATSRASFFDERWIDAPVRPGKRGGAFCAYTVPERAPVRAAQLHRRRRDVLTLAHELGHGLHAALARPRGSSSSTRR